MQLGNFFLKALQLALIADQEYAATQAPGASGQTLLQPNNFNNLITELATVFAAPPAAPASITPHSQAQAGQSEQPPQPGMVRAPNGAWVMPEALEPLTPHWATDAPKGTEVGDLADGRMVFSNGPGAGWVDADGNPVTP